jgi:hypothetical protein
VPEGAEAGPAPLPFGAFAGAIVVTLATLGIGLAPEPTIGWTMRATAELTSPTTYITTVLRDDPFAGPPEPATEEAAPTDADATDNGERVAAGDASVDDPSGAVR